MPVNVSNQSRTSRASASNQIHKHKPKDFVSKKINDCIEQYKPNDVLPTKTLQEAAFEVLSSNLDNNGKLPKYNPTAGDTIKREANTAAWRTYRRSSNTRRPSA